MAGAVVDVNSVLGRLYPVVVVLHLRGNLSNLSTRVGKWLLVVDLVIDARNSGKRYDLVLAAILIIGLIGLALDWGFLQLEKLKSVRWGMRSAA